jgi:hypothetical protein
MGGKTSTFRVLVGTPEGKERLENLDVYDKTILKWAVKYHGRLWTEFIVISTRSCRRPL